VITHRESAVSKNHPSNSLLTLPTRELRQRGKDVKAKTRERVQPKMGKIDIDYEKLHDALFKFRSKPPLTGFRDMYYEGKGFETLGCSALVLSQVILHFGVRAHLSGCCPAFDNLSTAD
jgi:hypothetical protein